MNRRTCANKRSGLRSRPLSGRRAERSGSRGRSLTLPVMDGVTISLAGAERIDDVEPVYRALYDHHVAVTT